MKRGCNPTQASNRYAHRPELRDLGWWMYFQRNRIAARLRKVELRIIKIRQVTKNDLW